MAIRQDNEAGLLAKDWRLRTQLARHLACSVDTPS